MANNIWADRINDLGEGVGGSKSLIDINANEIIDQAKHITGLSNFGDTFWQSYFFDYISNFNSLPRATVLGRLLKKTELLLALINRLLLVEKHKSTPLIKNETIISPLIISGLPRTGTTILFNLLSLNKYYRSPKGYEIFSPVTCTNNIRPISRERIGESMLDLTMNIAPMIKTTHDNRSDLPAECWMIYSNVLGNMLPDFYGGVSFIENKNSTNSFYNYFWHKKVLQTLQHNSPNQCWLLKCPSHLFYIESLFYRYPDAKVIHMHRDPSYSIPSLLSHLSHFQSLYQHPGIEYNHINVVNFMADCLRDVISKISSYPLIHKNIINVQFDKLLSDPSGTIQYIYRNIGLTYPANMTGRIHEYLEKKPRNRHGHHSYSASEFGLSNLDIAEKFRFYTDYYHIPTK